MLMIMYMNLYLIVINNLNIINKLINLNKWSYIIKIFVNSIKTHYIFIKIKSYNIFINGWMFQD